MSEDNPTTTPDVACTLTPEHLENRPDHIIPTLKDTYSHAEERPDGVTLWFDDPDTSLAAVAEFINNESECCAFATYTIDLTPPYDHTQLTITGPDGTQSMFTEGLVPRLEGRE